MPVRSLVDIASAVCIRHIRGLESVGDYLPYENVRHILLRVENATQLRKIEINSPQIEGHTGEIWLKLIERDFPIEYRARGYKPQDPKKWYKVWEKYKRDHDESVKESAMKLKNAFAGLKQDKEKNTSKIVERRLLPRRGATGPTGGRRGPREGTSNALAFGSGSRTKTLTGAGVMRKVRREVKEIANIHGSLSKSVRPGAGQQSMITKAPKSMINEHKRAAFPAVRPTRPPPKEPRPVPSAVTDHEARASFISDSEEDEEDGGDDLFEGDEEQVAPPPRSSRPIIRSQAPPADAPSRNAASPPRPKPSGGLSRMQKKFGGFSGGPSSTAKKVAVAPASSAKPPSSEQSPSKPGAPSNDRAPAQEQRAPPPPMMRKRKAADIFMRPKKRVP